MEFRYIAAYLVEGLQAPPDGTREIYSDDVTGKRVYLTNHQHEDWDHIDKVQTIAHITLTGMFGGKVWDLTQFQEHVSATTQARMQRFGTTSAFMILEASHEEDVSRIGAIGESADRDFCLALPNGFREEVQERHKAFLDQAQSFLYFAIPSVSGLQLIGNCILSDHSSGKPLYVLSFSMGDLRLTVSCPFPTESDNGPELLTSLFNHSADLETFQTTFKLFAGSATNVRDNLRAFLFAFTALESFLSRFFRRNKQPLLEHRKLLVPAEINDYLGKIEKKREEKGRTDEDFPIAYKFCLIASFLGTDNLVETVDDFDNATTDRNAVAHGLDYDETKLPTAKVWILLGRVVRDYMSYRDRSQSK